MVDQINIVSGAEWLREQRKRDLRCLSEPLKETVPPEKLHVDLGLNKGTVINDDRFAKRPLGAAGQSTGSGDTSADVLFLPTMRNRVIKPSSGT